ncbi:hypothetical protein BKA70DRAFT_1453859 [Coprinopsis sp. MPI-PUGE-AT-0042]|nr:hypothetical protein BKA70DRAFT_1453859 [Coprinopsis sp. MPI-PUGE-AT-0042]
MLPRVTVPQVTSMDHRRSDNSQAPILGSASATFRDHFPPAQQALLASVAGDTTIIQQSGGLMSNAENIQITGGNFVDISRGMVTNYNFNGSSASPVPVITTILEMLPAANFRQKHLDTLAKWTEGTSLWILEHRRFVEWYGSDGPGLLWGTGMQGAGKTISATSWEHLSVKCWSDTTICSLSSKRSMPSIIASAHSRPRKNSLGSSLSVIRHSKPAFSSLDEALPDIQYALLKELTALQAKVLVTSRPLDLLQSRFPDAKFLEIVANNADIERHINAKISQDSKLRAVLEHGSLRSTAIATIQNKSEGM